MVRCSSTTAFRRLTANDWFSNAGGVKDHLVRNQFGGSIGGPIYKDKTFFYAAFEDHRLRVSYALLQARPLPSSFMIL